ncbi:MAG: aminotransferase class I/II-fold pyridoxal phosphate-dependent enzyme [Prochloraceae cyanobacterium]|nr:aminotransferase class I/II-fold pyridoxal phosphate-dependent enzyme [Prochloraceae cyanobacterium]
MQFQTKTPLVDTLKELAGKPHAAFYAPGHKRGEGTPKILAQLLGKEVFKADLPELPELDNLFAPEGVIEEAQQLAAEAFGAQKTWFLVNGSTCGIVAAILATCGEGDKIILPRNIHQSAIAGLILSGAVPVFINPEYDRDFDLVYSIAPVALKTALEQHPDAKAVMTVYPTYQGVCGDLEAIAQLTHKYNIPLLVDEAHGAHFTFHPDLPPSALSCGADLTVQSIHKVLGAMTQASMLHTQGVRVDTSKISKALQLLETTSPNYILLASLDAARQQMALQGKQLLTRTLELADRARNQLGKISSLSILKKSDRPISGFYILDRTRLTVNVSKLGLTGFEADEILHQKLGVTAELPMLQHLTFIITIGNQQSDIDHLVKAFTDLVSLAGKKDSISPPHPLTPSPPHPLTPSISPREAFFASTETVPIETSAGRINTEILCPYPPGIPILMPGEEISRTAIEYLQENRDRGAIITGCSDLTLNTLKVLRKY